MGPKATRYLRELERKYGDEVAVREQLQEYFEGDVTSDFERCVIEYYEVKILKKLRDSKSPIYLSFVVTLFLILVFLTNRAWWLFVLLSFTFTFGAIETLEEALRNSFIPHYAGGIPTGIGILTWGVMLFIYFFFIEHLSWVLPFSGILWGIGFYSIAFTASRWKYNFGDASGISIFISSFGLVIPFIIAYYSKAGVALIITMGSLAILGCLGILIGLSSILNIVKRKDANSRSQGR